MKKPPWWIMGFGRPNLRLPRSARTDSMASPFRDGGDSSLVGPLAHLGAAPCESAVRRDRAMTIRRRFGIPLPSSSSEVYGARGQHGSPKADDYRVR